MFSAIILLLLFLIASAIFSQKKSSLDDRSFTTILRGIAIVLIMLSHLTREHTRIFTPLGGIGVAIFLILSGYGLNESFKHNGLNGFWKKRFIRVYIPYLIVLVAICLFQKESCTEFLMSLSLWHCPYWYVQYIFGCYVIFWLCSRFFSKYRIFVMLISGLVTLVCLRGVQGEQAISFVSGVILSHRNVKLDGEMHVAWKCIVLFAIIGVLALTFKQTTLYRTLPDGILINIPQMIVKFGIAIAIICLLTKLSVCMKSRFLLMAGVISYELYLVHVFFLFKIEADVFLTDNISMLLKDIFLYHSKTMVFLITAILIVVLSYLISQIFFYFNKQFSRILLKRCKI